MRLIKALPLITLLFTHQANAENSLSAWMLDYIDSINVEIDDKITDGCWTNLNEVREYAEDKLRLNRLKVDNFDGEYTLEIQGLGQRTLRCNAYVSIKIKSTGNNADGIASDALILLTRQSFIYSESKLNSKIIGFVQDFFNEFK